MVKARRWRVRVVGSDGSERLSLLASNEREAETLRSAAVEAFGVDAQSVSIDEVDVTLDEQDEERLRRANARRSEYEEFRASPAWAEAVAHVDAQVVAEKASRGNRVEDARAMLVTQGRFVSVESSGSGEDSYWVEFDDLAAHVFEDFVAESVQLARDFPGVTDARHEDRELIVVTGSFDHVGLERAIRDWWITRLRREAEA